MLFNSRMTGTSVQAFWDIFAVSKLKDTKGRGERPLKREEHEIVNTIRGKLFGDAYLLPKVSANEQCVPHAFAVLPGPPKVHLERGRSTTIRFLQKGTRQVLATSNEKLKAFMESHGLASTSLTPQAHIAFFLFFQQPVLLVRPACDPGTLPYGRRRL